MKQQILWSMLTCLLFITTTYGQGWEREYHVDTVPSAQTINYTTDGGFLLASNRLSDLFSPAIGYLVKTDINGDTLWTKEYPFLSGLSSSRQTTDGGYIVSGGDKLDYTSGGPHSNIYLMKTDANGDTLWMKTFAGGGNQEFAYDVQQTTDGGYVLAGSTNSFGAGGKDAYLIKTNANGDTLWTKTYGGGGNETMKSIRQTTDGGYILAGNTNSFGAGDHDFYLVKTDVNGDTLWTKTYGGSQEDYATSVQQTTDGGYILIGKASSFGGLYVVKIDANGLTQWAQTYNSNNNTNNNIKVSIVESIGGGYFLAGISYNSAISRHSMYVLKINTIGATEWTKSFNYGDTYSVDVVSVGSGCALLGHSYYSGSGFKGYLNLIKMDSLGNTFTNFIKGNIFNDTSLNCMRELGERSFSNILVTAISSQTKFGTTDSLGNYCIAVDTGTHIVTVDAPLYWQTCTDSIVVYFPNFNVTDTIDFPLQAQMNCPLMEVDLSAPFLRVNGFGSNYTVNYCNVGTVDEANVSIDVTLDPDLNVLGTSIPIVSQINNVLSFNIGNVAYGDCGSFTIQVQVGQNVVLGKTHCSEAHIYPDSICLPNWTGPVIKPQVICLPDSVRFTLENVGASVFNSTNYSIVEDHFIMNIGPTGNIPSGGAVDVTIFADTGRTYRIEVPQDPNYPSYLGDSIASIAIEGCNPYFNGLFNTGFVTQFSNGNSSPFIAVDCQQNRGSYDPNDKSAQPEGYDSQHYIYDYTDLDYKIRFQNTGTDTAFLVVIRDTISPLLDLTTLTMGASSHSYTWRIYNNRVLEVRFQNIMLPDSNVNEPASNGFVRYRIEQKGGNPTGTVIYNSADIYFDFNAPIKTNETWHTIGEDFILLNVISDKLLDQSVGVKVYPNPFTHHTTIEVEGKSYEELELSIFDVMGRRVRTEQVFSDHKIQLTKENLSPGIYLYELQGDKKLLNTGKIIVQ